MRLLLVIPALVLGHLLWTGTSLWLGSHFSELSQRVVDFLAGHLLESTLVCAALVAAHQYSIRRRRSQRLSK